MRQYCPLPLHWVFRSIGFLFVLFTTSACTAEGAREEFRNQLADDVEELVEKLESFHPGTEEVEQTVLIGGRSTTQMVKVPRAVIIGGRIKSLGKNFDNVSLALLTENIGTFDSWAISLKQDVERYREELTRATDELTARVKANPDDYTKPFNDDFYGGANDLSAYSPATGFGLKSLVLSDDGELYFFPYGERNGYSTKGLFAFVLDEWLNQVKDQSLSLQHPNGAESGSANE